MRLVAGFCLICIKWATYEASQTINGVIIRYMKKYVLFLLAGTLCVSIGQAQTYFQNTLTPYVQFGYNPAAAGTHKPGLDQGAALTFLGRLQWLGSNGPSTSYLSFDTDVAGNQGIGAMVAFDQLGPLRSTWLNVAYGFGLELGNNGLQLNIGANGGIKQLSLDNGWVFRDAGDAVIPIDARSTIVPALGAGLYLHQEEGQEDLTTRFYLGLSAQNLLEPSIEALTGTTSGPTSRDSRTFILSGGYRFDLDGRQGIMPTFLAMPDGIGLPQVAVSVFWDYEPISVGLNYRINQGESIGAMLGFKVDNRLFLSYAYDYPLVPFNFANDTHTHELVVTYLIRAAKSRPGRKQDSLTPSGEIN